MPLDVRHIPPHIGYYLTGFADGEGSFNVTFRRRRDYRMPWRVSLCFNVSNRDRVILALFKRYLQCGTLRQRGDGVWYYEVNDFNAILGHVIPFFERFPFLSYLRRSGETSRSSRKSPKSWKKDVTTQKRAFGKSCASGER